ncbi:MAG: hypothetical protein FE835_16320 [Gammaproteobacteria bacterium]|nr:hypothetical protein [Gammaproteobacteria bacterium]
MTYQKKQVGTTLLTNTGSGELNASTELLGMLEAIKDNLGVDIVHVMRVSKFASTKEMRKKISLLLIDAHYSKDQESGNLGLYDRERLLSDDCVNEPNISMLLGMADELCALKGKAIKNRVGELSLALTQMMIVKKDAQTIARELWNAGILGMDTAMAKEVSTAMKAGKAAIEAMVAALSVPSMLGAVVIAITQAFIALILFIDKVTPKAMFGLVVNRTRHNLVVEKWEAKSSDSCLYMDDGSITNFMVDNTDPPTEEIQIEGMLVDEVAPENTIVSVGIYVADDTALFGGAAGYMIFSVPKTKLLFTNMFVVPYIYDNGVNVDIPKAKPVDRAAYFERLRDGKKVKTSVSNDHYTLSAAVDAPRGGAVAGIMSLREVTPALPALESGTKTGSPQ